MPKDNTVADLDNLYRQGRLARGKLEPGWYLNLAYFANEQWLAWDGRQLFRPAMPKNRITVVDNRIQPIIRKEIAKMSKQRPIWTVIPNSSDEEDTNAAALGEEIMRFMWKHLHLSKHRMQALLWSRICSAGFIKCFWDSSAGSKRDIVLLPDGSPQMGRMGPVEAGSEPHEMAKAYAASQGLDAPKVKTIAQGDVAVEVRSPFQMFIDPLAAEFPDAEWVIEESIKSTEYVYRRYGVEVTADTAANPGLIEARMGMVYLPGASAYKGVKIREYWCKPNAQHPNGVKKAWVLHTQGKKQTSQILEVDDKPFDPMPYIMCSGIPMPGRVWPLAIVDALRGPQTEMNKVKSQIAENRNRVGNPSILASKQATQDPEKFIQSTTQPGGVIFYDDVGSPNAKPDILQAPPLPEYVIDEIQRIEESMQEISGQHEVTSAQVPPGVTAASAINLLQEADDTMLAPDIADHEEELGRLGSKVLKLVAHYYTDPRTISLGGDNGAWRIFDFKGSMLKGNCLVEVQAGSAVPQSKAAKQAQMTDIMNFLVQSGNPPKGRQLAQFFQDNDLGALGKLIEDYTRDETQANRENVLMAQGQVLNINPYDNDEYHIENHEDFEKEARFKQFPPQVQHAHLLHVAAHRERLQQQQQMAAQLQAQAEGGQGAQQQDTSGSDAAGAAQGQVAMAAQQGQQLDQNQQEFAQQQGYQQAQQEQNQRQAEEAHGHRMQQLMEQRQQAAEMHQQKLQHQEEQHQARLKSQAAQAAQAARPSPSKESK